MNDRPKIERVFELTDVDLAQKLSGCLMALAHVGYHGSFSVTGTTFVFYFQQYQRGGRAREFGNGKRML